MKIFPVLTAILVAALLYGIVFERDRLLDFARTTAPAADDGAVAAVASATGDAPATEPALPEVREGAVAVMAMRSTARTVDSRVLLRGETRAVREVEVRAETSGKIVSEPLRKGSFVEAGQAMCVIDPGTSQVALQEAEARLAEAEARLPESLARQAEAAAQVPASRARIAEAEAGIPAAEAALAEARAGVPAAEARLNEARSRVPEAEARLAEAETRVPAAQAALREARARVPAAEAALAEAIARRPEAAARVAEAEARRREAEINLNAADRLSEGGFSSQIRVASAEAAQQAALAQVEGAKAGVSGAEAAVESARSALEGARAGIESAKSQVSSARAGVEAARSQLQSALAGIETATSGIEGARAAVVSATSGIEGARAAVHSAQAQLQGAEAGIESARAGEINARAGIEAARAAVAAAERQIDRLTVTAPFAGLLESDTAELGALMQPGAACARIIQLNPITIVGFVPETEVIRVETGAPARAVLTGTQEVTGAVTFVSRAADPVTRTFQVELTVDNPDLSIRDGQTAEISIEADGARAHLLPQSALTLNDDGALGVRVVSDETTARFLPVTLLRDTVQGVLVAGLPATVDVITVGQEFVTDGVPLAPSFQDTLQ